jgi:hypothetical protein
MIMDRIKVIVIVNGGNVTYISSNKDIDLHVVDLDNIRMGDSLSDMPLEPDTIFKNFEDEWSLIKSENGIS